MSDVHRSVALPTGTWRRFAAFLGPGYMVAVGYMDPGNWATSLAGGSKFGYTLLVGGADVEPDGHRAAIALRPPCHRLGPRSGAGLPRRLSALYLHPSVARRRTGHHRHRHCRGDRHRHRPEPAVRHPAGTGRPDHRAGRVPDPVAAKQGLPLARGVHHHPAGRHRRLLSPSRSRWPIPIGAA